jgi:hypothetical protein
VVDNNLLIILCMSLGVVCVEVATLAIFPSVVCNARATCPFLVLVPAGRVCVSRRVAPPPEPLAPAPRLCPRARLTPATAATAAATATTGDARGVAAATTTTDDDDDDDAALTGEGLRRGPFAYMPFLAGPHACIGRKFAHLETCTALAVLLRAFSFAPVPGREVRATLQLTQRPTPSLQLIATPRS